MENIYVNIVRLNADVKTISLSQMLFAISCQYMYANYMDPMMVKYWPAD